MKTINIIIFCIFITNFAYSQTCQSDLGVLTIDSDGVPTGEVNEVSELISKLKENCPVIEIRSELKGAYGPSSPRKIIYIKNENLLKQVFLDVDVTEEFTNVTQNELMTFQSGGGKCFFLNFRSN